MHRNVDRIEKLEFDFIFSVADTVIELQIVKVLNENMIGVWSQ